MGGIEVWVKHVGKVGKFRWVNMDGHRDIQTDMGTYRQTDRRTDMGTDRQI